MAGVPDQQITDRWAIYNADCMDMLAAIPEKSIHATIYSPPFSGLYHYSSDDRDVQRPQLRRVLAALRVHHRRTVPRHHPGSAVCGACRLVPTGNSGSDAYTDFRRCDPRPPGPRLAVRRPPRHLERATGGAQSTLAKNLAHRTICDDGAMGGVAAADELLIFRKPGNAAPVIHPNGLHNGYAGGEPIPAELLAYRAWTATRKPTATRTGSGAATPPRSGTTSG